MKKNWDFGIKMAETRECNRDRLARMCGFWEKIWFVKIDKENRWYSKKIVNKNNAYRKKLLNILTNNKQ